MSVDQIQFVRRLKFVNCLSIREIVKRTGISRNTVRKILRSKKTEFSYERENSPKPALGNCYELIEQWLKEDLLVKKKYKRTAKRIYVILCQDYGYKGSYESIARCIREVRREVNQASKEAYIPLYYEAGDAFQFDWGEVYARVNKQEVKLQLAALQLSHSRAFFAHAYPNQKHELMLDAHCRAFNFFGGSCKRGIYDNMKTAVKRVLCGRGRLLQERFKQLCSHYLYVPEFCNIASGNEKGRVENLIGTIRRNFFAPIPEFETLEDLNSSLLSFCVAHSRTKNHPEFHDQSRYEVFERESQYLIPLPAHEFESCRLANVVVSPSSTVRFDNNRYSVPTAYVGRSVLVKAFYQDLVVSYKGNVITRHLRSYKEKHLIFDPTHYLELLVKKPRAFEDGMPFKGWDLPSVFYKYRDLLRKKVRNPDKIFAQTLLLLKDWPLGEVTKGIEQALKLGLTSDSYILSTIRRQLEPQDCSEPISIDHKLGQYKANQKALEHYDEILRNRRLS